MFNRMMRWTTDGTLGHRLFHLHYPSTVLDQWSRMLSKCSLDRMTHVHFGTSAFGTSKLRSFVGGETPKVKLPEGRNLLTSLVDMARVKWLPLVTQIHDLHIPDLSISS
jgi:hypothetical protein